MSKGPMTEELLLAAEFAPIDYDQWTQLALEALRGKPLDKLNHETDDGIPVKALYTAEDWRPDTDGAGMPGFLPYTRGKCATPNPWAIAQCYSQGDPQQVFEALKLDSLRGVEAAELRLDWVARTGQDPSDDAARAQIGQGGMAVYTAEALLPFVKQTSFILDAGAAFLGGAALALAASEAAGADPKSLRPQLGADPLGALAETGVVMDSVEASLADLGDLAAYVARDWPHAITARVSSLAYHQAGATPAEELALAIATGVAYLEAMLKAGLSLKAAAKQISFHLAVDCDFFANICKLRVFRRLWGRVLEAAGAPEAERHTELSATTADRMLSQRDPWVNILRTTVAGFAGAMGGADLMVVRPYDAAIGQPDALSLRIARNTQLILREESSLGAVIDPGGGAWYLESHSEALAEAAWKQFQAISAAGGAAQELTEGRVHARMAASWDKREIRIATRKEAVTGVSEFPNIDEAEISREPVDAKALLEAAKAQIKPSSVDALPEAGQGQRTKAAIAAAKAGASIAQILAGRPVTLSEPLPKHRYGEAFEALRDLSDGYLKANGSRPKVFLANLGPVAAHTGRATFAKNFFEAGGIDASAAQAVESPEEAAQAFQKAGAKLAVLCSSDAIYEAEAAAYAKALKAAGAERLYLAGRPSQALEPTYREAGIDAFIYMGSPVLDQLKQAIAVYGVSFK